MKSYENVAGFLAGFINSCGLELEDSHAIVIEKHRQGITVSIENRDSLYNVDFFPLDGTTIEYTKVELEECKRFMEALVNG